MSASDVRAAIKFAHHIIRLAQISKSTKSVPPRWPIYFVRTVRCGYLSDWGRNPNRTALGSGKFTDAFFTRHLPAYGFTASRPLQASGTRRPHSAKE